MISFLGYIWKSILYSSQMILSTPTPPPPQHTHTLRSWTNTDMPSSAQGHVPEMTQSPLSSCLGISRLTKESSPSVPATVTWIGPLFFSGSWEGISSPLPQGQLIIPDGLITLIHLYCPQFALCNFQFRLAQVPTPSHIPTWTEVSLVFCWSPFPHCSSYWRKAVLTPSTNIQLCFSNTYSPNLKELKYGCLETCSRPQKHVIATVSGIKYGSMVTGHNPDTAGWFTVHCSKRIWNNVLFISTILCIKWKTPRGKPRHKP